MLFNTVGSISKFDDDVIIEGKRLYIKYDGPEYFIEKATIDGKEYERRIDNSALYDKFIYLGEISQDPKDPSTYTYTNNPDTPNFIAVHTEGNEDTVISRFTAFGGNANEVKLYQKHSEEELAKLLKYEKENFDANTPEIKEEKINNEIAVIEKTIISHTEEIQRLERRLEELRRQKEECHRESSQEKK